MALKVLARQLRKKPTHAEWTLWRHLRRRRTAGAKFRRQQVVGPYIVDFICFEARLIVEADGGQHMEQAAEDQIRTHYLNRQGYHVLRFWNHEVLNETETVLGCIWNAVNSRLPSPPGQGLVFTPFSPRGRRAGDEGEGSRDEMGITRLACCSPETAMPPS
ncbi:DNA methyltransferase [Ectothiorhodospira sp. PHS-1]|uniref:endonuclease domain-containing protein n=1 Tax=Ectothiorhodospira sp. PHS-1 TaxID=519989 RepID=UPI00024A8583|nr:endonuclease domain-containing protein [Ectothiorhodospira sp. PHS-1]EHQ52281.1 DNA methyltransferase [Ectothiorhodospira sp. PHS-1]